jgi:hypothetical protein
VQIQANGTWRQLGWTPGGWVPLIGTNDSGTWRLLPSPSASSASTVALVRFVAAQPATAATAGPATPQQWTTQVMLTSGRHARARFVEGTIVANYLRLGPSATGGPTGNS